jgi:hypothetical protein
MTTPHTFPSSALFRLNVINGAVDTGSNRQPRRSCDIVALDNQSTVYRDIAPDSAPFPGEVRNARLRAQSRDFTRTLEKS